MWGNNQAEKNLEKLKYQKEGQLRTITWMMDKLDYSKLKLSNDLQLINEDLAQMQGRKYEPSRQVTQGAARRTATFKY